jgi:uncharacterized protein
MSILGTAIDRRQLAVAVEHLRGIAEIGAAYLHGSAARDALRPDSDIDLALLLQRGATLSPKLRLALTATLESVLRRPVDIGILSPTNLVFCKEVVCAGRLLFTRDQLASDLFAAHALSMYVELQERRKEVLDVYAA